MKSVGWIVAVVVALVSAVVIGGVIGWRSGDGGEGDDRRTATPGLRDGEVAVEARLALDDEVALGLRPGDEVDVEGSLESGTRFRVPDVRVLPTRTSRQNLTDTPVLLAVPKSRARQVAIAADEGTLRLLEP